MRIKPIATLFGASVFALLFSSCESKQEEAREQHLENKADSLEHAAKQVRKDGGTVADMKEDQADAIRHNNDRAADATENGADATRRNAEKQADSLENKADAVRDQK